MSNNRVILENDIYQVKACRHGPMAYHKSDTIIGKSLERYGEWCESELDLVTELSSQRTFRVILDVGANVGTHTLCFARLTAMRNGQVHAFEAQRGCFTLLCCNIALNGLQNVVPHHAAISDTSGSMGVPAPRRDASINFGGISLLDHHPDGDEVNMIAIDDLGLDGCDLIKIDIEGMEQRAILGASKTINRFRPVLFVENNTLDGSAPLLEALFKLNYRCYWHIKNYYSPRNYNGAQEDIFGGYQHAVNVLCLPIESKISSDLLPVSGPEDNWQKAAVRMGYAVS